MVLKEQTLVGKRIHLDDSEVHFLGPALTLVNCEVVSDCSAEALTLSDVSFDGGSIEAKKPLTNFQWCRASLRSVRFSGAFTGCDFGRWEEFHGSRGEVKDCDFSNADLDNCRFMNCQADTLRIRPWPWFAVLEPSKNAEKLRSMSAPGKWALILKIYADSPAECSAVVANANVLLKRLGGTADEVKETFKKLNFVLL